MGCLDIELARTIDEDRYREAERCHRINRALAVRRKQSADRIPILVRWLQSLVEQERRTATGQQTRKLAELS